MRRDVHIGASAPYKRFAKQNLETGGIHFRRFEINQGDPARQEPGGANIAAHFKLKKVDMVESLKTVE